MESCDACTTHLPMEPLPINPASTCTTQHDNNDSTSSLAHAIPKQQQQWMEVSRSTQELVQTHKTDSSKKNPDSFPDEDHDNEIQALGGKQPTRKSPPLTPVMDFPPHGSPNETKPAKKSLGLFKRHRPIQTATVCSPLVWSASPRGMSGGVRLRV